MTAVTHAADVPVRKTVTVRASVDHAFKVYTEGFDTWWPRSHHIGRRIATFIVMGWRGRYAHGG
jgi:hypothetical protein